MTKPMTPRERDECIARVKGVTCYATPDGGFHPDYASPALVWGLLMELLGEAVAFVEHPDKAVSRISSLNKYELTLQKTPSKIFGHDTPEEAVKAAWIEWAKEKG